MDLIKTKADMRKAAFAARKVAHGAGYDAKANVFLKQAVRAEKGVKTVAGYMPIRTEISPLETMSELVSEGYRVTVPVIIAEGSPLRWAEWSPNAEMVEGPFGAVIPKDPVFLTPDLLICPLVAFDNRGGRLGYGGGFYDRSLELLRRRAQTVAIGFAYDAQEMDNLPLEETDQPLNAMVTESGMRVFDLDGFESGR